MFLTPAGAALAFGWGRLIAVSGSGLRRLFASQMDVRLEPAALGTGLGLLVAAWGSMPDRSGRGKGGRKGPGRTTSDGGT
jgi:hypothetical protein